MSKNKVFDDINSFYEELQRQGRDNADGLVQVLKDAKILESINKTEEEAKKLFIKVEENHKISRKQFEKVMADLQRESSVMAEELNNLLLKESAKFMRAAQAAKKAFEDNLEDKPEPGCCVT